MRILRKTVKKSFLKSRWALVSTGVSLSIRTVISSYKLIKLGKHTFLLVKPCWLFSFSTWVWKWITGLAIPSPYQGSRWLAFSSWSHFLVALLEDMSDVYFPPVSGNFFLLKWSIKNRQKWHHNDTCQFLQCLWVYPIRVHGFRDFQLVYVFSDLDLIVFQEESIFLVPTFSMVSWNWDSWKPVWVVKAKEAFSTSAFVCHM